MQRSIPRPLKLLQVALEGCVGEKRVLFIEKNESRRTLSLPVAEEGLAAEECEPSQGRQRGRGA